jgi:hypothetical protein
MPGVRGEGDQGGALVARDTAPDMPKMEARLHLSLPKEQADKLKGLGVGETLTIEVTGTVKDLSLNEYENSLGLTVESCDIEQARHMTMSDAMEKSTRKRRGYPA